jgi:hypothetical protein
MTPLSATVDDSGTAPTPVEAVDQAASAASSLFDQCAPSPNASVVGTIVPPAGSELAPAEARCEAFVKTLPSFTVVTFVITMPSDVPFDAPPDGLLTTPDVELKEDSEVIVWRFVVIDDEAIPVASATAYSSRSADAFTSDFEVSTSGWSDSGGSSSCGGMGFASGGNGKSAYVVFLEACAAAASP